MSSRSKSALSSLSLIPLAIAFASLCALPAVAAPKSKGLKPSQVLGEFTVSGLKVKNISCDDESLLEQVMSESSFSGLLNQEEVRLVVQKDEEQGVYAFLQHEEEDNFWILDVPGDLSKQKDKIVFSSEAPYQSESEALSEDDFVSVLAEEMSLELTFSAQKKNAKAVHVNGSIIITVSVEDSYEPEAYSDEELDEEFDLDAFLRGKPSLGDDDLEDYADDEESWESEDWSSVCEIELSFSGRKI